MNVIDNILKLLLKNGAAAFLNSEMEYSVEQVRDILINQRAQCEEIITDNELGDHDKAYYRNQLKNINMALNKLK
jgi:hypothetical protein